MKVLIINTMAPFVWGGAEELAEHLARNLRLRGHDADLLRLPFRWDPFDGIPAEIARFKAMRLPNVDRVISMKFPAYYIPAENTTTWLIHQYRQAYDLWDSPYNNLPHNISGEMVRDFIRAHDDDFFGKQRRLFTISTEVSRRLQHFNGVVAPALRAPINDPELFCGGEPGGFILAPGRVNGAKRQHLLVEAMQYLPPSARLIVAGPPETQQDARILEQKVADLDLGGRVKLDLRFLSREELAEYVNHATAIAYLPFQEDSYGYVTMEAFEAGKPVITCDDAGELLDIVLDEQTGFVCEPEPEALAAAMATLLDDATMAEDMGRNGQEVWRGKNINWDSHISRLLGDF
jgi:glycosyltransferase involved in cell wall biosynthesis